MEQVFDNIAKQMIGEYPQVLIGVMMRSPALTYRSKVFAFYHDNAMIFKLEEAAPFYLEKYPGTSYLNPFKNKPPMKGWLVVPSEYSADWQKLAIEAYRIISNLI